MSKLITFLGTGYYERTKYRFEGFEPFETELFQEAMAQHRPAGVTEMYVFLTEDARNKIPSASNGRAPKERSNWAELSLVMSKYTAVAVHDISIPDGKSVGEMWEIFEKVGRALFEGDSVYFDITHGFRSLPMMFLLAASYFQATKNIKILGLFYGAFDAKTDGIAPVFDLTAFVELLALTAATTQFLETGSVKTLSDMLKAESPDSVLAANIRGISDSLDLLRPQELMINASELPRNIEVEQQAITNRLPPVGPLLDQIGKEYGKFGMTEQDIRDNPMGFLKRQHDMILWYRQKQHFVHCVATAKEWIITFLCVRYGADSLDFERGRKPIEALPGGGNYHDNKGTVHTSPYLGQWQADELKDTINRILSGSKNKKEGGAILDLSRLRNDLMHVGFSKNPESVENIVDRVDTILLEITALARDAGILEAKL